MKSRLTVFQRNITGSNHMQLVHFFCIWIMEARVLDLHFAGFDHISYWEKMVSLRGFHYGKRI